MNFIVVNKDQFLDRKNNYEISSCIKNKYNELLKHYECFQKSNNLYFHKYNKNNDQRKRSYPDRSVREPKKTLQSLWNVLNESNYLKKCHKLMFLFNEDNLIHIVSDILKNAVIHSCYRKYFIIVLNDLIGISNRDVALSVINAFYHGIIDGSGYIYVQDSNAIKNIIPVTTDTEYDIFCKKQKHKTKCLNTNMLVIEIINNVEGIDFNMNDYIMYLLSSLLVSNDDFYIDIYLNMIIDICSNKNLNTLDLIRQFDFSLIQDHNKSLKNKFLIERIRSMI